MAWSALLAVDASTGMPCLALPSLPADLLGWRSRSGAALPADTAEADRLGRISTLLFAMAAQLEDSGVGVGAGEWEAQWPAGTGAGASGASERVRVAPSAVRWVKMGDGTTLAVVDVSCTRGRQGVRLLVGLARSEQVAGDDAARASNGKGGIPGGHRGRSDAAPRPGPIETEEDLDGVSCSGLALGEAVAAEVGAQFVRRNWTRLSRGGADPGRLSAKFMPHLQGWAWRFGTRRPGAAAGLLEWAMAARADGSDGAGSAAVAGVGRPIVALDSSAASPGWIAVELGMGTGIGAAHGATAANSERSSLVHVLARLASARPELAVQQPSQRTPVATLDVPASARGGDADACEESVAARPATRESGGKSGGEARAAAGTHDSAAAACEGLPAPQRPRPGRAVSAPAPRRQGRGWLPGWLSRLVTGGSAKGDRVAGPESERVAEVGGDAPASRSGRGQGAAGVAAPEAAARQVATPASRHGAAGLRGRAPGPSQRGVGQGKAVRGSHTLEVPLAPQAPAAHEGPRLDSSSSAAVSARAASAPRRARPDVATGSVSGSALLGGSGPPVGPDRATACVWVRAADWGSDCTMPVDAVPRAPPRVLGWSFQGEISLTAKDARVLAAAGPSSWAQSACGSRRLFCLDAKRPGD